jgi:hypothetical protein
MMPIAWAETAALVGLLWIIKNCVTEPTTITLCTSSSVVYYTLLKGTGFLRNNPLLQNLYLSMIAYKIQTGHGLVIRWVPSQANLADPPHSRSARTIKKVLTSPRYKSACSHGDCTIL